MTSNTTAARPKLVLKPHERERAQVKGLLAGLEPTAPEPAGGEQTPPPVPADLPTPEKGVAGPPGPATPVPRLTLMQALCRDFAVEWLPMPLAIGIGAGLPIEVRWRLARLVRREKYLRALATSPHRYQFDGSIASEVSAEHRDSAIAQLEHMAAKAAMNAPTAQKDRK